MLDTLFFIFFNSLLDTARDFRLVQKVGFEPTRQMPTVFETAPSTYSAFLLILVGVEGVEPSILSAIGFKPIVYSIPPHAVIVIFLSFLLLLSSFFSHNVVYCFFRCMVGIMFTVIYCISSFHNVIWQR